jgi:hypothetical protein
MTGMESALVVCHRLLSESMRCSAYLPSSVPTCDLGHGEPPLRRGQQVHVVAADARRQRQLQLGRLLDALLRHVRWPEGLQAFKMSLPSRALVVAEDGAAADIWRHLEQPADYTSQVGSCVCMFTNAQQCHGSSLALCRDASAPW